MDQIQTSSSSGGLLHFSFDRKIAAQLQLKCSMLPAKCEYEGEMSTTHLVAIGNQVRQRNKCYKQFVNGFMLRKHSNKEMGKGRVKIAKKDLKYFILLYKQC